jgi:hypothetical protein
VTQVVAQLPTVIEALAGLKLEDIVKRVPSVKDADADVDAEEIR